MRKINDVDILSNLVTMPITAKAFASLRQTGCIRISS